MSSLFSPPDRHRLSRAATYSLLRVHPPPHITFRHCLIDSCGVVTSFSRFAYGWADAAWMMPGFPSYCAGSLLVDHVSNHLLQLFLYRASRLFARSLLQPAESSLLTLRSLQLPITSFRPQRWPLTPLRVGFSSQETGRGRWQAPTGFASFAGQTKKHLTSKGQMFRILLLGTFSK